MRARWATAARALALIVALSATAVLAGCGGGGDSGSASSGPAGPSQATPYQVVSVGKPVGPPPDREDITAAQRRIASVAASGDCNRIADLYTTGSASGKTQQACALITQIGATTPTGTESYGNEAGVIDYATLSRGATLVLLRQADGLLHIAFSVPHDRSPSAGTPIGKGADAVAARAVKVLHDGNCDSFLGLAYREAGVGLLGKPEACYVLANDPIHGTTFNAPDARPQLLGGNQYFAFYDLNTPQAYVLMVLARNGLQANQPGGPASGPYRYLTSFSTDRTTGY
jgi:hypothetical protein